MDILVELLAALVTLAKEWGVFAGIVSLGFWWLKKKIDAQEAERKEREKAAEAARQEREKATQDLILLMLKESRSTNILAMATAKAVQRIPDAHCNGDMTKAITDATALQSEEKNFLFDQGIRHIFGDN